MTNEKARKTKIFVTVLLLIILANIVIYLISYNSIRRNAYDFAIEHLKQSRHASRIGNIKESRLSLTSIQYYWVSSASGRYINFVQVKMMINGSAGDFFVRIDLKENDGNKWQVLSVSVEECGFFNCLM